VTLDDWQAIGIICGALLALLTLVGVLYRKVIRPVFRSMKLAARLLEQLVGDPDDGIPSLMERLARFDANQSEMARKLDDHLEWHANPGGRPAKATGPRPNGPAPGRR
jgi:hypothetical protein